MLSFRKRRTPKRLWMVVGGLVLVAGGGLGMVWSFYVGGVAMLVGLFIVTLGA